MTFADLAAKLYPPGFEPREPTTLAEIARLAVRGAVDDGNGLAYAANYYGTTDTKAQTLQKLRMLHSIAAGALGSINVAIERVERLK